MSGKSEKDVPCVRHDHFEWFAAMPGRDQVAYLVYSLRFGIDCDHMSEKAFALCRQDADRFIDEVVTDQRKLDQKRRELHTIQFDAIGPRQSEQERKP